MASPYIRTVHSQAEMDTLLSEKSVVVVSFYAAWSAPCRKMASLYSRLATMHRSLTFVKVEIDEDNIQPVGQKARLTVLPTFIMIKAGEEIDRVRGADRMGLEAMITKQVPEAELTAGDSGSTYAIAAGDESLLEFLDMPKVNCLNEAQDHPLKSIVEKKTMNTTDAYLESDADEQLLITLPFNQEVKVRSVILYTKDSRFGPKKIKIDINKLSLGFDDVENATEPAVIQVLEVPEEVVKEGKPIHLRFVRLQHVNSLHIFVEFNHGNEYVTRIDAIEVYGPGYGEPTTTTQINGLRDFNGIHERGMVLWELFEREGGDENISNSVAFLRESALLCPAGHRQRRVSLGNLAISLLSQYKNRGDHADLNEAITLSYEALELGPPGHPDRAPSLNNLAKSLYARYEYEGSLSDLEEMIEMQREALNLFPPGHPNRAGSLNNLATVLCARYAREGSHLDMEEMIEKYREALDLCPPGRPGRAASFNNLARALSARYDHEGSLSDLEERIEKQREALNLFPPGHPNRATALNGLVAALSDRYEREGGLSDLEEMIEKGQQALNLLPPGHPDRTGPLNNLGATLSARYKREGSLSDLEDAIEKHQEVLNLQLPDHPDRAAFLTSLANSLSVRYIREGSLSVLEEIIEKRREALNLQPPGHPDRARSLNTLANALLSRYKRGGSLSDIEEATAHCEDALQLRPHGHLDRSIALSYLCRVYLLAIDRKDGVSAIHDNRALLAKVFTMFREAAYHSNSPPFDRLEVALEWINASSSLDPGSVGDAYTAALDQLDIVLATNSTLANKHSRLSSKTLSRCQRLGVEAASCAVRQGNMALAVEFLERGRNLLFAQVARYRVELEELQKVNPELVKRFSDLSGLLDSCVVSDKLTLEGQTAFEDPTARYRRVALDWEQAVNDIRAVPGFESFLRPPDYTTLQATAAEGPIVIVIPDNDKSHALIILQGHDTPHYVGLPKAGGEEFVTLCNEFIQAVQSDDESGANKRITILLRKLWVLVVGPIADALENELRCPLGSRIWWCPSSLLSFLPLHAAGRYASDADPNQNFPARYVSSYTPTLQALGRARSTHSDRKGESMLIVAQPDTPGQGRLPNTIPEAGIVRMLAETKLKMKTTLLTSEEGAHSAVLNAMVNHSWIHLTCHGSQNPADPFDSCFYLYDKKLTLHDIIQRGLPDARFAFLAACHTSTGDPTLLDEGLHLAAGLQFAGFKSVVGTIWEVADIDGPVIAEAFYRALQAERVGEEGVDCRGAARALSTAVRALRDNGVPISRWIRHIHIGI